MTDTLKDIDIYDKSPEKPLEEKEYTLTKDNTKYNIKISKTKDKVIIYNATYEAKFYLDDFVKISKLFCICKAIDELYFKSFLIN